MYCDIIAMISASIYDCKEKGKKDEMLQEWFWKRIYMG
jgi:hypothetical protein